MSAPKRNRILQPAAAMRLLEAFADAYHRHDVDGVMGLMNVVAGVRFDA